MRPVPHAPSDEETARRQVERYLAMTSAERIEVFTSLLADMDALLAGRMPVESPEDSLGKRWRDPSIGRPS